MDSTISDLALDLGVFALNSELENGRMLAMNSAESIPSIREEQYIRCA
jgi:hypothetical protein